MADPTKGRTKGYGRSSANDASGGASPANPLIFTTAPTHGRSCQVDLTEFAVGRPETHDKNIQDRGGAFKGRRQLIEQLAPSIRGIYAVASRDSISSLMCALRNFWRFLDDVTPVFPCESLADINETLAALWIRSGTTNGYYKIIRKLVFENRRAHRLAPQFWPRSPRPEEKRSEAPNHSASKALYQTLKIAAQAVTRCWAEGDSLVLQGSDPRYAQRMSDGRLAPGAFARPADRATMLKALMAEHGSPIPPYTAIPKAIQYYEGVTPLIPGAHPSSVKGIGGHLRWFYPSFEDACIFFNLFLLLTGWNPQVALDIDTSSNGWWEPHPLRSDLVVIHSIKNRARGTVQTAISLERPQFHPYQLLRILIERTDPLRRELLRRLSVAEAALLKDPTDTACRQEVERLQEGGRSPWLYFSRGALGEIEWLRGDNLNKISKVLDAVVEQANLLIQRRHVQLQAEGKAEGMPVLIAKLALSDFRDAWIGYAYANSGYSWLMAQLAAGHKSVATLRNYLRHRRWRAHSEKQYLKFMDVLWTEIRARRIVDGAILRWMVNHGQISDEQRQRWEAHKDRTRMGMGCRDFRHPPSEIAPDHVEGSGCRIQRCTLCRYAIVFQDSLDSLARRLAELEYIQRGMPLPAWLESSFPEEVEATELTLSLFTQDAVQAAVDKWRTDIASGRHYVFQFEGNYQEVANG